MTGEHVSPRDDDRARCIVTGNICDAKLSLLENAARDQEFAEMALDRTAFANDDDGWNGEEFYPRGRSIDFAMFSDSRKVDFQIKEYDARADVSCEVASGANDCPTLTRMQQSTSRSIAVKLAKTLRIISKGRE